MAVSHESARELIIDLHLLGRLVRGVATAGDTELNPAGLGVIAALDARGVCRQADLALDLCLSQSALSRQITELVNDGYVDRQTDPDDRRAAQVSLSAAGRDLLQRNRDSRARALQVVLAKWSQAEAEAALISIQKLTETLTEHVHRAARSEHTSNRIESQEANV